MTGKPIIDKVLIGLNLATLIGGLALFIYTTMVFKKPLPDEGLELSDLERNARLQTEVAPFKLEKMTINLSSEQTRLRFLDVEVHLLPFKDDGLKILTDHKSKLFDIIIEVTGTLTPDELNSISGKILLESRLKKKMNDYLRSQIVREIYFSTFIVQ
ncbi:MAG: flagellar basal body-associated FliL family protein [Bacteriovoracaceae bacterium]